MNGRGALGASSNTEMMQNAVRTRITVIYWQPERFEIARASLAITMHKLGNNVTRDRPIGSSQTDTVCCVFPDNAKLTIHF